MSVADRENCNPSILKLCGVSEENLCQVKIAVKHQIATPEAAEKWPGCRSSQRLQCHFEYQRTSLN